MIMYSVYDPLHSLPLAGKHKFQYGNDGRCCQACDYASCKGDTELGQCVACVPAQVNLIEQLMMQAITACACHMSVTGKRL